MHLRHQRQALLALVGDDFDLGSEHGAGVIAVGIHRKAREMDQVDAITLFECIHIGIAKGVAQHIGNTTVVAYRSTHPECIMVAPLDVKAYIFRQGLHDDMCPFPSVVDVAENVEPVDAQPLDHVANRYDEVVGLPRRDDCLNDPIVVELLALATRRFVEQLFYYIGIFFG